jgi:hypothetical protein
MDTDNHSYGRRIIYVNATQHQEQDERRSGLLAQRQMKRNHAEQNLQSVVLDKWWTMNGERAYFGLGLDDELVAGGGSVLLGSFDGNKLFDEGKCMRDFLNEMKSTHCDGG